MTHFDTSRIKEMLGLQVGVIRDLALRLDSDNLELFERNIAELEDAIKKVRSMVEGLPHRHQA